MKYLAWCAVLLVCLLSAFGAAAEEKTSSVDISSGAAAAVKKQVISGASASDLDSVFAFPNPFKGSMGVSYVRFTNLPTQASIRIYTVSGELVRSINKNNAGTDADWDVRNDTGSQVASGLYLYIIDSGDSARKTGKLIVLW